MDTTNIVALLLFVLPGILAEKISCKMDFPATEKTSDFKEIVNGILLSLPIIFVTGIASAIINKYESLNEIIIAFDELYFLITFSIIVFSLAIVIGVIKGVTTDLFYNIINKIRSLFNKMEIDDKCCWRRVFLDNNVSRYIKIIQNGEILREGFGKYYSLPNEEKSIVLEESDYLNSHPDLKELFKLWKTYVNTESGVIVEIYDTSYASKQLTNLTNPTE